MSKQSSDITTGRIAAANVYFPSVFKEIEMFLDSAKIKEYRTYVNGEISKQPELFNPVIIEESIRNIRKDMEEKRKQTSADCKVVSIEPPHPPRFPPKSTTTRVCPSYRLKLVKRC